MTASTVESVVATGHAQLVASPTHPFAGLSRKRGNEVLCLAFKFPIFLALMFLNQLRIYHLGPKNILQDHVYFASSRNSGWYQGTLHKLGIILTSDSALAAIEMLGNEIRVYYQGWCD